MLEKYGHLRRIFGCSLVSLRVYTRVEASFQPPACRH
jgi:hypothetical protein